MMNNMDRYGSNDCGGYDDFAVVREKSKVNKRIAIVILCVILYGCFIYAGYSSTTFKTTNGVREAQVVDIEARKGQEDYNRLKLYYVQIYNLFQEVYQMDDDIRAGRANKFAFDTRYQEILSSIDSYMATIQTLNVDTKYKNVQNDLLVCFNYFAIYVQKVDMAVTDDSLSEFEIACTWLDTAERAYYNLSYTFVEFEHSVKIYDDPALAWYEEIRGSENVPLEYINDIENYVPDDDEGSSLITIDGDNHGWVTGGNQARPNSGTNTTPIEDSNSQTSTDEIVNSLFGGDQVNPTPSAGGYGKPIVD